MRRKTLITCISILLPTALLLGLACAPSLPKVPLYTYRVVASFPHNPNAYTQGFFFADGVLFESTGQYGSSQLRCTDLQGRELRTRNLDGRYFGEGACLFQSRIYQLTWMEQKCFVYDKATFDLLGQASYPTEGWGLTANDTQLVMSDGSAKLYFLHPETFQKEREITVRNGKREVSMLNELEWIEGEIWANVYTTDKVVRIDPATGQVTGEIDFSGLLPSAEHTPQTDVFNGIAYDKATGRIWVTGKNWPKVFQIEVVTK